MTNFPLRLFAATLIALLVGSTQVTAQDDAPRSAPPNGDFPMPAWKGFDDALKAAGDTEKKLMVFVYADWCGWCRRIDREVFSDEEIRSYLGAKFASARVNGESDEKSHFRGHDLTHRQLAQVFGTTGYPNTVFLTEKGEYITRLPGFLPADQFLEVLKFVGEDAYLTHSFEEFQNGN